jgi:hypothetical protein
MPQSKKEKENVSLNPVEALASTLIDRRIKIATTAISEMQKNLPKSKTQISTEESMKAVEEARKAVKEFKAQYKKPEKCYDMKNEKTRIWCANDFIRARKAWESQNSSSRIITMDSR